MRYDITIVIDADVDVEDDYGLAEVESDADEVGRALRQLAEDLGLQFPLYDVIVHGPDE